MINHPYTKTTGTVSITSAEIITAKPTRRYLRLENKSAADSLYLEYGAPAVADNTAIKILPNTVYEPLVVSNASVNLIGENGVTPTAYLLHEV